MARTHTLAEHLRPSWAIFDQGFARVSSDYEGALPPVSPNIAPVGSRLHRIQYRAEQPISGETAPDAHSIRVLSGQSPAHPPAAEECEHEREHDE